MKNIIFFKYFLLLIATIGIFSVAEVSLASGPCTSANIRWAGTSNRVYISGDVECTLTQIKTLGSSAIPLNLVDSAEKIWFLGANMQIENGAKVVMKSSLYGGDVNKLRLKSNNSSLANSFVEIKAEVGSLDINGVEITSWDEAVSGPDTEYSTYKRAFIRVRSKLGSDSLPKESRMDIKNSDISYLGFNSAESYGLSWKVLGSTSTFDLVGVYGDVENNKIHHNYFGVYTYGAQDMKFLNNEVYQNIIYGLDPHDDSDYLTIQGNNVHHNGKHGMTCSKRCNNLLISQNTSNNNGGNGIILHWLITDSVVENNITQNNVDSGIAIFDSHNNIIKNNNAKYNGFSGIRLSVGSSNNIVEENISSENSQYGFYFFKGSDNPVSGDGRVKLNTFRNNTINSNGSIAIKMQQADSNTFEGNTINGNGSYVAEIKDSNNNVFKKNTLTGNTFNYYYAKLTSVNSIQDSDVFGVKIGDTPSTMTITHSDNAVYQNSKNILTKVDPSNATILVNKSNALSSIVDFTQLNFSVTPDAESLDIKPLIWNTSGDFSKKWTAKNNSSISVVVHHVVGDLNPATSYRVVVNGSLWNSFIANDNGEIIFDYSGVFQTTKTFEVKTSL